MSYLKDKKEGKNSLFSFTEDLTLSRMCTEKWGSLQTILSIMKPNEKIVKLLQPLDKATQSLTKKAPK